MANETDNTASTQVVSTNQLDRATRIMLFAVFFVLLMILAVLAYAYLLGGFGAPAPRTSAENSLVVTEAQIRSNPKGGVAYATRAETLYGLGRKAEAYQTLAQGEKAIGKEVPAILYVLRTWTALLNHDGNYAEAVKVGTRGMSSSNEYLLKQGAVLYTKRVTNINANLQVTESVDMALQTANAYMGLKQYDKALELYDYANQLEPLGADVLSLRGYAYLAKGDKTKAKADFQEALKYLPNDPTAKNGLAQASK